jgi:hypothetical protein
MKRGLTVAGLVAALLVMGTGIAIAGVSDGNYRPERQGCSPNANDTEREEWAPEKKCQNFTVNVRDRDGNEGFRAGLPQLKNGEHPDPRRATVKGPRDGFDPTNGPRLYIGADDNLDNGEHDGSDQVGDGPSDGGAIVFNVKPKSKNNWFAALLQHDWQYLFTHPIPYIDAGFGSCADGVCESVQTQRHTAYDGGSDTAPPRDAANYDGYTWDPHDCSGADSGPEPCENPDGLRYWHNQSGDVYVEPGVQFYEDPNPAGSPIGPYPLPSAYVGTCGVILGGGPSAQMPASPITNSAGQFVITTKC